MRSRQRARVDIARPPERARGLPYPAMARSLASMKTGTKPASRGGTVDSLSKACEVLLVLEEGARECPELLTPEAVCWLVGLARAHLRAGMAQKGRRPKRATRQAR